MSFASRTSQMKYIEVMNNSASAIAINTGAETIRVEPGQKVQLKYDATLYKNINEAVKLSFLDIRVRVFEKEDEQIAKPKPVKPTKQKQERQDQKQNQKQEVKPKQKETKQETKQEITN